MSAHRPFEEVQAERPPFEPATFQWERVPKPDWRPGQGARTLLPSFVTCLTNAPPDEQVSISPEDFTQINPKEYIDAGNASAVYKLMINGIVASHSQLAWSAQYLMALGMTGSKTDCVCFNV